MKKIIKNKVYDTATAQLVGVWDNGRQMSDFAYSSENLYRKKNGEFFLYGWGGPFTIYGNDTGWGERITPLCYEDARKWAEENLDGDSYIAVFGEPAEDDGECERLSIRISAQKMKKLRQAAGKAGTTIVALVESMIDELQ